MEQTYQFGINANKGVLSTLITALSTGVPDTGARSFEAIVGKESMSNDMRAFEGGMNFAQKQAFGNAVGGLDDATFAARHAALLAQAGVESFTSQLDPGKAARQKAATIQLNVRANRQWDAAEAMFTTVIVPFDQEVLTIPIDVAGVGSYNVSDNSREAFEDLRPIASILSDSKFETGDDLKLVPVLPQDVNDANFDSFVKASDWTPWDVSYDKNDLLGRQAHKTNYLAVKKIPSLLGLTRAPGSAKYEQNDEIEASSLALQSLLLKLKTKDGEGNVTLFTLNMPNSSMRPSTGVTADEKRQINFVLNGINVVNLKDAEGNPTQLFKSLTDAGLRVFVQLDVTVTYHRSTRTWSPTVSPVEIAYVIDKDGNKLVKGATGVPESINALLTAQAVEASVHGILPKMNHANTNRSRYGITVVYANTTKTFGINKRQPISVKYPMLDADNNGRVLEMLVKEMDVIVTRNMSHDAFKAARAHFDYVYDNNGMKTVNINDDSSSVLPGQHFLVTTAINAKMELVKEVSTLDSKSTIDNVSAALVNRIWDVITALRINSNTAALKELDKRDEEYVIIAHASLAPFLLTKGDFRTFGENIKFEVVETNIDSEVGNMWIIPKSHTKDGDIDIFGGIGICVTKELLVIEGQVAQSDRQYRMIITQPAYQHHAITPVIGRLTIEDIGDILTDEGIITRINKLLVKNTVANPPAEGDAKEVEVDVGG